MVGIACDHGGYELKLQIISYLEKNGKKMVIERKNSTGEVL